MLKIQEKLNALGIILPPPPKAVASYIPAVVQGNWCYTSGQLPFSEGKLVAEGIVGQTVPIELAQKAARQAALNALSVAADAAGGLHRIQRLIKLTGFVQCASDFHQQPIVVNGASDLFGELMGEFGRHARSAVGTHALPLNAAVEIECLFWIE